MPVLNDFERQKHFTLNKKEISLFKSYKEPSEAVYFLICLVFFKIKRIFIYFNYQDIQPELQHLIKRYFIDKVDKISPSALRRIFKCLRKT